MKTLILQLSLLASPLFAQTTPDSWKDLAFLNGTWNAKGEGQAGAAANGTYTFQRELGGHIHARHSSSSACKGPADFDCNHGDLLYVYEDAPHQPLKAIYFDNEGHVIHYDVSIPQPNTVVFLSEPSRPGPQFRLTYELKGSVMSGRFQMHVPDATEWKSYLQWSGSAQTK